MTADRIAWFQSPPATWLPLVAEEGQFWNRRRVCWRDPMTGQHSTRAQYMAFVMLRLEGESHAAIARWAGCCRPTVITAVKHSDAPLRVGRVLLELARATRV